MQGENARLLSRYNITGLYIVPLALIRITPPGDHSEYWTTGHAPVLQGQGEKR